MAKNDSETNSDETAAIVQTFRPRTRTVEDAVARPRKRPGDLGIVRFERRGDRVLARARIRDTAGQLLQLSSIGATEADARKHLEAKAHAVWFGLFLSVEPTSTVQELAALWLQEMYERPESQLRQTSKEKNERTLRAAILTQIGAVPVEYVTPAMCHNITRRIERDHSPGYARAAYHVLKEMLDLAVLHGALASNPMLAVKRPRKGEPEFVDLDHDQVNFVLQLMEGWNEAQWSRGGSRPNTGLLRDIFCIIAGSSLRPGEVLALRREDVHVAADGRTDIRVAGSIVYTKARGIHRYHSPKSARQTRWIPVASVAVTVLRQRMANYVDNSEGLLFTTASGRPYAPGYVGKLMRRFREECREMLVGVGVIADRFSLGSMRKVAATVVADGVGLTLARDLLGHSDIATTRSHYAAPRVPRVSPTAAEALDRFLGG